MDCLLDHIQVQDEKLEKLAASLAAMGGESVEMDLPGLDDAVLEPNDPDQAAHLKKR